MGSLAAFMFVIGALGAATEDRGSPETARLVSELFDAGYGRGSVAFRQAQSIYDRARSLKDPRVEYAWGLVLLRQLKNKDALEQFESITKAHPDYWPAWQGTVWMHLISRDQVTGLARAKEFARRLAASREALQDREELAEWLGQVLAALQKSVDTLKQRELLQRDDEGVVAALGADLQPALTRGRQRVDSLHGALEEGVQQTRQEVEEKQARERAEREAQVAKDLESSAERKDMLKRTAEQSKDYLDQRLGDLDRQLGRFEKDYDVLQQRILALNTAQVQINSELAYLDGLNPDQVQSPRALEQRRSALGVQLLRSQVDLEQSLASAMTVAQRAQAVMVLKAQAVQQYEKATGQLVQKEAGLDKWQDRLKKEGEKLKAGPKGKAAPVANRINQLRSLRTYVELDPVRERERVMESLAGSKPAAD